MALARFLTSLLEEGRVRLPPVALLVDEDLAAADRVLVDFERQYRQDCPLDPPVFSATASRWAATRFFRACQFAVFRDIGGEVIDQELDSACGERETPALHYSVDLVFRFLPDLLKFSRSAAENDPLVGHLMQWAHEWPLSSVGIPDVTKVRVDGFLDDRCLERIYADRILAAGDTLRLNDRRVRDAVASSLGCYPDLVPKIAEALRDRETQETRP